MACLLGLAFRRRRHGCALWLAVLIGCLSVVDNADAAPIPLVETPCGTAAQEWRCFGTGAGTAALTTNFDQPDGDWTISPVLPEDAANWRVIDLSAGFGNTVFQLVYPVTSTIPSAAMSVEATFTDSAGRVFSTGGNWLMGSCDVATVGLNAGKPVCSDGNGGTAGYHYGPGNPLDPDPPSFDGPITIHVDWTYFGEIEAPESSSLYVGAYFNYVLEKNPIPEPGTGILVMTGLLGLAYRQRRSPRTL